MKNSLVYSSCVLVFSRLYCGLFEKMQNRTRYEVASPPQARGESARTHSSQTAMDFKEPSFLEHYTQSNSIPTRLVRQRH